MCTESDSFSTNRQKLHCCLPTIVIHYHKQDECKASRSLNQAELVAYRCTKLLDKFQSCRELRSGSFVVIATSLTLHSSFDDRFQRPKDVLFIQNKHSIIISLIFGHATFLTVYTRRSEYQPSKATHNHDIACEK